MDYNKLLDESFLHFLGNSDHLHEGTETQEELKAEFLASDIFDLTTYDSALDLVFVREIMGVIEAIHYGKTFDYFKNEQGKYITYIRCVNLPWFGDKLNWGSSIRGAWWDYFQTGSKYSKECKTQVGNGCLWYEEKQAKVVIDNNEDWKSFIDSLISFWRKYHDAIY